MKKIHRTVKQQKTSRTKRSRKDCAPSSIHKAPIIIMLVTAFMGLVVIISFAIISFNILKMNEISNDDENVQELMARYFYGDYGCFDTNDSLLGNEKIVPSKLSQEQKEKIVIGYLAESGYSDISYNQINSTYRLFFGHDQNLEQKMEYSSPDGKYINYRDGDGEMQNADLYYLEKDCSTPPELVTCVVLDKAYQTESGEHMKLVLRVFTVDTVTNKIYSGVGNASESIAEYGQYGDFDAGSADLARWEALFKYDNLEEFYRLVETKKQ